MLLQASEPVIVKDHDQYKFSMLTSTLKINFIGS